jgi:hypothetical protein
MLGRSTMKLEKIITLANEPVRLRFLAMERSLRATGCDLPLWVIPYDDRKFDLPPNAQWWSTPLQGWLEKEKAHRMMFKYQCLTQANYQYVDTDIVFLKNPAKALENEEGFIANCAHWRKAGETVVHESFLILREKSTCWNKWVFNCGQFACDRVLYTDEELKRTCLDPRYSEICLRFPFHDQPGIVLLVNLTDVPIHNLTLPPRDVESSWAGDYEDDNYERYWKDDARKPYLLHWAGCFLSNPLPIDELFKKHLTPAELEEWNKEVARKVQQEAKSRRSPRQFLRTVARSVRGAAREFRK